MTTEPTRLRAVLIGAGKVGAGYAADALMARYYPFATHAQVLAARADFDWQAVVDSSEESREATRLKWRVPHAFASVEEMARRLEPEVAVIATPPETRMAIVEALPCVRAVLVEKPLGLTCADGEEFLAYCERRGIVVEVNLWRRADATFRSLAAGRLRELVGGTQTAFVVYGNGLANNGTHMIDFVRMLLGEVESVQTLGGIEPRRAGPIGGDVDVPFSMRVEGGVSVAMHPVRFEHYRENGLDVWGEKGRLSIRQEGLGIFLYPRRDHRAMQDEREVASDEPRSLESTVGHAFYEMYGNLAAAVRSGAALWSPGDSALQTTRVVEAVLASAKSGGAVVTTK
jgi:predicted dehydrogenase